MVSCHGKLIYFKGFRMNKLKRVLAINDISGVGKCSLTVNISVVSSSGVECAALPTALLSTHTGEFEGYTFLNLGAEIVSIAKHWKSLGVKFDGIISGYISSVEQVGMVKKVFELCRNDDTLIFVDPIMADNGVFYSGFDENMCDALRELSKNADVICPNITEAAFLAGVEYKKPPHTKKFVEKVLSGLKNLNVPIIAISGIHPDDKKIGTIVYDSKRNTVFTAFRPLRSGIFYGAGDIFTSSFSALITRGADTESALKLASELVDSSISHTYASGKERRFGTDFEPALCEYTNKVEAYFNLA